MSEHLCNLSTGDKVYFYDKSIVIYFQGARKVLSTSLYNGGYHDDLRCRIIIMMPIREQVCPANAG